MINSTDADKDSRIVELERQEREGYERIPDTLVDWKGWEKIVAWPED